MKILKIIYIDSNSYFNIEGQSLDYMEELDFEMQELSFKKAQASLQKFKKIEESILDENVDYVIDLRLIEYDGLIDNTDSDSEALRLLNLKEKIESEKLEVAEAIVSMHEASRRSKAKKVHGYLIEVWESLNLEEWINLNPDNLILYYNKYFSTENKIRLVS